MVRLFADVTQDIMRTIRGEMTKLFTVETNNGVTRVNIMTSLVAVPTSAGAGRRNENG